MSGDKLKWTTDNTCQLIELYREHSLLWDAGNKEYKNRYKKADALKEIGKCLNVSAEDVERKIKNINTQYQRELRNYKSLRKSGAGASFHSKWFGYELLSFLKNKNKPRKTQEAGLVHDEESDDSNGGKEEEKSAGLEMDTENENTENTDSQVADADDEDVRSEVNSQNRISHAKTISAEKTSSKSTKIGPRKNCEEVYGMLRSMYQERRPQTAPDDFDVYGEIVARKLRKLRTPYAQITVQHLMDNLLYDAQMGKYDEPSVSTSSAEHELAPYFRFPVSSPASTSAASYSNPPSVQPPPNVFHETSTTNNDDLCGQQENFLDTSQSSNNSSYIFLG